MKNEEQKDSSERRSAGILLHITSLPSAFGIGDLGPKAMAFAGFLHRGGQSLWQVLPLNPTAADLGHAPYSAISSMAGNPLLISPELLVADGLLTENELQDFILAPKKRVDFKAAETIRKDLFGIAYGNFVSSGPSPLHAEFKKFCQKEAYWLEDFALYSVIKQENGGQPWYQWPDDLKVYNESTLSALAAEHHGTVALTKWLQFIFFRQWNRLRVHCNQLEIRLVGDLPFYVSYDSADVWSHQEVFRLDSTGKMEGVAGVPPDYFNDKGQLWGMPVFRWDILEKTGYDWWIKRIRKNVQLYDLVRLDHFRAFSSYWEVPGDEETAVNGQWKMGPGSAFFDKLRTELGYLPFIAEDLGDVNADVYCLRDAFGLPGMKVLQFAFGDNMPQSEHIPHNHTREFVVYTGTHDNNTTSGWYKDDVSSDVRRRVRMYLGKQVSKKTIHLELAELAYASVAKTVILPLQDVLGFGSKTRMNMPASTKKNWLWRLKPGVLSSKEEKRLKKWTRMYNRMGTTHHVMEES